MRLAALRHLGGFVHHRAFGAAGDRVDDLGAARGEQGQGEGQRRNVGMVTK